MPIKIEYRPDKELDALLKKILATEPDCKRYIDYAKILICFVSRNNEKEGVVKGKVYAIIKKISQELQLFVQPKAQYIVVIDEGWWLDADTRERDGAISRQLSRIKIKVTDGGVKFSLSDYDIKENVATLKRHGAYSQELKSKLDEIGNVYALMDAMQLPAKTSAKAPAPTKAPEPAKEKTKELPKKMPEKTKPEAVNDGETNTEEGSEVEEVVEKVRPARPIRDRVLPEPVSAKDAEDEVPEPERPPESDYETD